MRLSAVLRVVAMIFQPPCRWIEGRHRCNKGAPTEADALNLGPSKRTHGSATTNKGCLWRWRDALANCSR